MRGKETAHQFADWGLVFDDQDGFGTATHLLLNGRDLLGRWRGISGAGEKNLEGRAATDLTFNFDPSLVLFNDAINSSQTQARALADFLGREERLEQTGQGLGGNAANRVGGGGGFKTGGMG